MKARKPNPCIGCGRDVPGAVGRQWTICEDCRAAAVYHTPPHVLGIIDPASGSGGFLADVVGNPPFGAAT